MLFYSVVGSMALLSLTYIVDTIVNITITINDLYASRVYLRISKVVDIHPRHNSLLYFITNILYDNDIGALSKIQSLWLSYNSLTGAISSSFGTNNGSFYILKIMNVNNALTFIPIKRSCLLRIPEQSYKYSFDLQ